jgi:hypothetical protein
MRSGPMTSTSLVVVDKDTLQRKLETIDKLKLEMFDGNGSLI